MMDGAPFPRFGLSLRGGFELTGPNGVKSDVSGVSAVFPLYPRTRTSPDALGAGLTFLPPEIRQKPREQTRTRVNDLDRVTLILFEFPARVLRS